MITKNLNCRLSDKDLFFLEKAGVTNLEKVLEFIEEDQFVFEYHVGKLGFFRKFFYGEPDLLFDNMQELYDLSDELELLDYLVSEEWGVDYPKLTVDLKS